MSSEDIKPEENAAKNAHVVNRYNEVHNATYDLTWDDVIEGDATGRLFTLAMHGAMTMETLTPTLVRFVQECSEFQGDRIFLYFSAQDGSSLGSLITKLVLTTNAVNPYTPMGKFIKTLGEKKVVVLNNTGDSGINKFIGEVVLTVKTTLKKDLNVIDIPQGQTAETIVRQLMRK